MKSLLLTAAFLTAFAAPTLAEDAGPTIAQLDNIVMSERLIAAGTARKDAVLILAGIKLRNDLAADMGTVADAPTSKEDAYAAARAAAAGDDALLGMIDDMEAEGSRRMPICTYNTYGSNYCY
ncbi:hypothetical protein [Pseudorhodobacter sp. E13]|uniref:hypothetical protein n=1 Tax=Pseudorhodobacter sp. E13 TaxID=2487931 RepID=UPI000F8D2637|nr:hypothetical protein [Pseudorhodobacter sp. E13]